MQHQFIQFTGSQRKQTSKPLTNHSFTQQIIIRNSTWHSNILYFTQFYHWKTEIQRNDCLLITTQAKVTSQSRPILSSFWYIFMTMYSEFGQSFMLRTCICTPLLYFDTSSSSGELAYFFLSILCFFLLILKNYPFPVVLMY